MDPITQVVTLGSSAASGEDTWFRANVRSTNTYNRSPDNDQIHTAYDNDHIYFVHSVEPTYNGSNGYRTQRGEIWKVKKRDGSTVWHKSFENVDGAYEVFLIQGCDISPNGNYLVIAGTFNKEGVGYGNYSNFRYGFVELSTADGSLRTTANGALYAGGVKDDTANNNKEREGGILYKTGSNDDFIIPGAGSSPAYTGFARIDKGSSAYTTEYHVDMYGQTPFNDYLTSNQYVRGMYHDPDNSNQMWFHREDYYNSKYYNYFLLYNVSGGTPTYVCGLRLRVTSNYRGKSLFTAKYTSSSNIELYIHTEYSSTTSKILKVTWNGSSWTKNWQNVVAVSNGGYGARACHAITYDDDNDRLVVWESDPPNTYVVRQINTSTGANVNVRRIAISGDANRTNWAMNAANTNGASVINSYVYKNPCFRAADGYMYVSLQGLDEGNAYDGHLAFKVSTDISELPSSETIYNTNVQGNSIHTPTMSFVITSQEPVGSYSTVGAASVDADVDNLGSHTPTLYGSSSGPMQYYNWNENSCDEWLTASTDYWPSDIQIKID